MVAYLVLIQRSLDKLTRVIVIVIVGFVFDTKKPVIYVFD